MVQFIVPIRRRRVRRALIGGVLVASTVLAGGCSGTIEDVWSDRRPSYRSSRSAPPLEVPPDLTSSTLRDSLQIPGVDATHSQYASDVASGAARSASAVLPEIDDARIERGDGQRWLVIAMKPEETWPRLRDFWIGQGFAIETEEPNIGILETDWAEEHTSLPAGLLKRLVNQLTDALYGITIRDRYRTRIERGTEPDTTDIYISHSGAEQVVVGNETHYAQKEGLGKRVWQPRPRDPGLESEMLSRLMVFLGADQERADAVVAASTSPDPRARLMREDDGTTALVLGEGFSPSWRRTSIALDRAGFTVEDRDRSRGLFFVRYAGREDSAQSEDKGWLSKLKFWGNDDDEDQGGDAYVVQVMEETPAASRVVVLDQNGVRDESRTAVRILTVLAENIE